MITYLDNPNLKNLNELGVFLKESKRVELVTKMLFEKCKNLLHNDQDKSNQFGDFY